MFEWNFSFYFYVSNLIHTSFSQTGEENEEMASSKVVKAEEQEKPKEPEEAKVTKVF